MLRRWWISFGLLIAMLAIDPASAAVRRNYVKLSKTGVPLAAPEAAIDRVAYTIQKKAILKLKRLLKMPRYKKQRHVFLMRLARLQQENADISFRIAHAEAYYAKRPINLKLYRKVMKNSRFTLDRLIRDYPKFEQIALAYLLRAQAFAELGKRKKAIKDFEVIVNRFPKVQVSSAAYLGLADYAEEDGKFKTAIRYLRKLTKRKGDPEYPQALYKLAWDFYYLNNVPKSMDYVKQYVSFFRGKIAQEARRSNSLRKNEVNPFVFDEILVDSVMFYEKGTRKRLKGFLVSDAMEFFRDLARGPRYNDVYPQMLVRYAKLLRASDNQKGLKYFKKQVLSMEAHRKESLDLLILVFEDQLVKYEYKNIIETVKQIRELWDAHGQSYAFDKAENSLLNAANRVQRIIGKSKKLKNKRALNIVLSRVYDTFLAIADPKDPRRFQVHYNLAEALLGVESYGSALSHFEWIIEQGRRAPSLAKKAGINLSDIGTRIVAIRYQDLRKKKKIPANLKPVSLAQDDPQGLDPELKQWLKMIYNTDEIGVDRKKIEKLDFYFFEANRALYANGHIKKAVKALTIFAEKNTRSKYSVPAAKLVIDTYIASGKWNDAYHAAMDFRSVKGWKDKKFEKKLYDIAANAYYKETETYYNEGKHDRVIKRSEEFERMFGKSSRSADFLNLVGQSAVATKNSGVALVALDRIIEGKKGAKYVGSSLLLRAQTKEDQYDFLSAANDYNRFLKSKKKAKGIRSSDIAKKVLLLTWLSGDYRKLKARAKAKHICRVASSHCARFTALAIASLSGNGSLAYNKAIRKGPNAAIWAIVALERRRDMSVNNRLSLIRTIAKGWNSLDPLVQYSLIDSVSSAVSVNLYRVRKQIRSEVKIKADQQTIANRVAWIKKIERTSAKAMELPWLRLQAGVLNQVASLYTDLASDIYRIKAPGALQGDDLKAFKKAMAQVAKPIYENGKKIRRDAFELASSNGVEGKVLNAIMKRYFLENPEEKNRLLPKAEFRQSADLDFNMLVQIDPRGGWNSLDEQSKDLEKRLKARWATALRLKKWATAAYYLKKIEEKKLLDEGVHSVMRAIALAKAGAKAEGLAELEGVLERDHFNENKKEKVAKTMVQNYLNTYSKNRIRKILKDFDKDDVGLTAQAEDLVSRWTEES